MIASSDPWAALGQPGPAASVCLAWLQLLARRLGARAQAGMVLLRDGEGQFVPAAMFPSNLDATGLADTAQAALDGGVGVRRPQPDGSLQAAYPVSVASGGTARLGGLVVLALPAAPEAVWAEALTELHWGAGWLAELLARQQQTGQARTADHAAFLLDLQAAVQAQPDLERAQFELVNRLATRLDCHQVLLGRVRDAGVTLVAMSHAAWFDDRAGLLQQARQAMNEALDQQQRTVVPAPGMPVAPGAGAGGEVRALTGAGDAGEAADEAAPPAGPGPGHAVLRQYADDSRSAAACALPLEHRGEIVAICLLQRDAPFDADALRLLDMVGLALGPTLALQQQHGESLWAHGRRRARALLARLVDGSHPGWKLLGVGLALLLVVAALWPVTYRVTAKAVLEGQVQRAAVAPFAGFIREAPARAGDLVKQGQVLAVLDDKELRLEAERWRAELQIAEKGEREARAKGERADLRLASAQAAQAAAQLGLAQDKLARVQVLAPFDGVVVRGDLSQQLGSPVELGKVLFELAPLSSWRVIVQVDERDIGQVAPDRSGELVLTSQPGRSWPLKVARITPVSVPEEGRNHFRVEAALGDAGSELRPGMEGVAKIDAGRRSLLWIWSHRFIDWVRLSWWRWSL